MLLPTRQSCAFTVSCKVLWSRCGAHGSTEDVFLPRRGGKRSIRHPKSMEVGRSKWVEHNGWLKCISILFIFANGDFHSGKGKCELGRIFLNLAKLQIWKKKPTFFLQNSINVNQIFPSSVNLWLKSMLNLRCYRDIPVICTEILHRKWQREKLNFA